jgi:hypothetical protein
MIHRGQKQPKIMLKGLAFSLLMIAAGYVTALFIGMVAM